MNGAARIAGPIRRAAASRYAAVLLVAFFFGTAAAWLHNTASVHVDSGYPDEGAVLIGGALHTPLGRANLRVGEMNRWFARLLYPGGVYYMNRHMGGGPAMLKKTGWEENGWKYAGGYYLAKHLHRIYGPASEQDPNVQDFVFFMRLASGLIAAASFCLVLWGLHGRFGFAAAAAYASLILGSPLVFEQLRPLYSEATLFIVFNLAAFLWLRYGLHRPEPPSLRIAAWAGVLCAAALSTKLTGVMIVALLAGLLIADARRQGRGPIVRIDIGRLFSLRTRRSGRPGRRPAAGWSRTARIEACLLFFLAFMFLINVPYGSVFEFVTQTMNNVYNHGARHRLYGPTSFEPLADDTGVLELLLSVRGIGYLIVLLFPAALLSLLAPPRRALIPVYALGAAAVLVVWSFSNQMVYLPRSFASVYVAMSFVAAVAAGDLLARLPNPRRELAAACASPALALALLLTGASVWSRTPPLKETFFENVRRDVAECASVAAIGFPDGDVRTLREAAEAAGGEVAGFPRTPRYFHRKTFSYDDYKEQVFARYQGYECLAVYREAGANTKQVTNFFAPRYYELRERVGKFFFFAARP